MIERIGIVLGKSIDEVEEVDVEEGQIVWGCYLRVRVVINISKPSKRGSKVVVPGAGTKL